MTGLADAGLCSRGESNGPTEAIARRYEVLSSNAPHSLLRLAPGGGVPRPPGDAWWGTSAPPRWRERGT